MKWRNGQSRRRTANENGEVWLKIGIIEHHQWRKSAVKEAEAVVTAYIFRGALARASSQPAKTQQLGAIALA
jgi:hypothetical protein